MACFDHPFLPHFNSTLHSFFFAHCSYGCLLFIIVFFLMVNEAWYLDPILQKLVILRGVQSKNLIGGDFPLLNHILLFQNQKL